MSLVAYDSSDESDGGNIEHVKKKKESVKITIPSLKEFEDEEDEKPMTKRLKLQSASGLFSLLPPPKNTPSLGKSGFMPHILLSKKERPLTSSTPNKKEVTTSSTPFKTTTSPSSALTTPNEQESDDEYVPVKHSSNTAGCDFFWLDDLASKNKTIIEDPVSVASKRNTLLEAFSSQLPCSSSSNSHESYMKNAKEDVHVQQLLPALDVHQVDGHTTEKTLLNDEQIFKLQGRRREFENIDIIDVKADDQLSNRNEWLMKSVTEETTYRPKKKHGLPTQQQKRKHQITYLAFQAKEREMDLKNQWAVNRLTRRETQSKYGF